MTDTARTSSDVAFEPPRAEPLTALVRAALAGEPLDGTRGPEGRVLLSFAVPSIVEMAMQSVLGLVEISWVSHLGGSAVALVGTTETLFAPVYAVGVGLSIGTTAVVARRMGENRPASAGSALTQGLWLSLIAGALLAIPAMLGAHRLLALVGISPSGADETTYARLAFSGIPPLLVVFVLNAGLRAAGRAGKAMSALLIANVAHLLLGPLLIYGLGPLPGLSVSGAAIAVNVARVSAIVYQLHALGRSALGAPSFRSRVDRESASAVLRIGSSAVLQMLLTTGSWAMIVRVLSGFGSAAVAGYTGATRVLMLVLFPSFGLANAVAVLVGQNLGASQPERAERFVRRAALFNVLYLGATGLLLALTSTWLAASLLPDPDSAASGAACLLVIGSGLFAYGYGLVGIQAFNGAGDGTTPAVVLFVCYWLVELPLAVLLSQRTALGARGVFVAMTLGFVALSAATLAAERLRHWKFRR